MPEPPTAPTESRRIGRYLLFESVGTGGMGEVHRARSFAAAGVTKDVCIKQIRAERLARPGSADRFIEEARVAMRLAHGNIVPVFDFGRAGDRYYLAMEWVEGADLKAILREAAARGEPLTVEVAAHVGAEIARALTYAHELGAAEGQAVVHRDIKPANVLVSRAGDVKLTDFGVATLTGASSPDVGGTPAYMAPEQIEGGRIGPATDIFALGVLLTEMLIGARPVAGSDCGELPSEVADLVRSMLAVDPSERPASARAVADTLERIVGRSRARGERSARDDLAERATRTQLESVREPPRELGADASYVRDGTEDDFSRRMAATISTLSIGLPTSPAASPARDTAEVAGPRRVAAPIGRVAVVGVAVIAVGALAWTAFGPGRDPGGEPPPGVQERDDALPGGGAQNARSALAEPAQALNATEMEEAPAEPLPDAVRTSTPAAPPAMAERAARPEHGSDRTVQLTERSTSTPRPTVPTPRASATAAPSPAVLRVQVTPWAEVLVDGRSVGVTPITGLEVSPGTHTVRLVNAPLHQERSTTLVLAPGEHRDLLVDLR